MRQQVERIRQHAEAERDDASLHEAARKVSRLMLSHWVSLTVFLEHPEIGLDNNLAEQALRPAVVGRKNYYGSGSQWAGELAAGMMSLLATLERFIGWNSKQRLNNLPLIVNNTRFLILPWVQVKGLASKVLALAARQLPRDWQQCYSYQPVLLETFVEWPRHAGTCYKVANWQLVGRTVGRGKKAQATHNACPPRISGSILCAATSPSCSGADP